MIRPLIIDAIKFQLDNNELLYSKSNLDLNLETSTGYIINEDHFDELEKRKDELDLVKIEFKSRGSRFRTINSKKGIPFFKEKYNSIGRLKQGVKCNLEHIEKKSGKKIFIIGVEKEPLIELEKHIDYKRVEPDIYKPDFPHNLATESENERAKIMLDLMMPREPEPEWLQQEFIGKSYVCQYVRQQIIKAGKKAYPDYTVLILGDPGTGKEIVARSIHKCSDSLNANKTPRKKGPFITQNCAAIPHYLLEAELFGSLKDYPNKGDPGRIGTWVQANGGTLFLDEIGDISTDHQPKILRALQFGEIVPVGSSKVLHVDARVIAATNRDVESMAKKGLFRKDLIDRLKIITIKTPTLRSHPEDIPEIAIKFWRDIWKDHEKKENADISPEAIVLLQAEEWEDNVRGLESKLKEFNYLFPGIYILDPDRIKMIFYSKPKRFYPCNEDKSSLTVPVDLLEVMETLARASHETWKEKRLAEGWKWGPKRVETKNKKTNPDLKSWEKLTEKQKSYAREEAKAIIRALLEAGYKIEKTG